METHQQIAKDLLSIGAVTLSPSKPFVWASGLRSPVYCDNRLTISHPKIRKFITTSFVSLIRKTYPDVDAIVGTATAGIPQACWVADILDLPTAYVRSSSKTHGKENQIEGQLPTGSKVIVIEDLISTGGSSIAACKALADQGMEVMAVISIFTYQLPKGIENFKEAQIEHHSLCRFADLLEVAQDNLNQEEIASLELWNRDPIAYDQQF